MLDNPQVIDPMTLLDEDAVINALNATLLYVRGRLDTLPEHSRGQHRALLEERELILNIERLYARWMEVCADACNQA